MADGTAVGIHELLHAGKWLHLAIGDAPGAPPFGFDRAWLTALKVRTLPPQMAGLANVLIRPDGYIDAAS